MQATYRLTTLGPDPDRRETFVRRQLAACHPPAGSPAPDDMPHTCLPGSRLGLLIGQLDDPALCAEAVRMGSQDTGMIPDAQRCMPRPAALEAARGFLSSGDATRLNAVPRDEVGRDTTRARLTGIAAAAAHWFGRLCRGDQLEAPDRERIRAAFLALDEARRAALRVRIRPCLGDEGALTEVDTEEAPGAGTEATAPEATAPEATAPAVSP